MEKKTDQRKNSRSDSINKGERRQVSGDGNQKSERSNQQANQTGKKGTHGGNR